MPPPATASQNPLEGRDQRPRFRVAVQVTATLLAVALLTQAITAGLLLSIPAGRSAHSAAAAFVLLTAVAQLVAAILVWRPGGGSPRLALISALLLVLVLAEALAGAAGISAVHVPLGALLLAVSVVLIPQTWAATSARSR